MKIYRRGEIFNVHHFAYVHHAVNIAFRVNIRYPVEVFPPTYSERCGNKLGIAPHSLDSFRAREAADVCGYCGQRILLVENLDDIGMHWTDYWLILEWP